jgi:hypothetical protein
LPVLASPLCVNSGISSVLSAVKMTRVVCVYVLMSAGCEVPEEVCTLPLFLCVPGDTMTVCMCKGEAESFKSSKVTKLDT